MYQFLIKLSTLADIYSEIKQILDSNNRIYRDAKDKLEILELEFGYTYINALDSSINKVIKFRNPNYGSSSISVSCFLNCYYEAQKVSYDTIEEFLFSNDTELKISNRALTAIYGEQLVGNVISNSIRKDNNIYLIG